MATNIKGTNNDHTSSAKRGCPPLTNIMPAKRNKQPSSHASHLPAEMWAAVMGYLDFTSVLIMTASSRTMYDASPLVYELHITKSCQMHGSVARRFKDVQSIFVYSLVQQSLRFADEYDDDVSYDSELAAWHCEVDYETCARAAPFLSAFTNLKQVYFGGTDIHSNLYQMVPYKYWAVDDVDSSKVRFSTLTDSLSAAFRCGTLPSFLELYGLICITRRDSCQVCTRACQSFPIKSVAAFESTKGITGKPQNFICLERSDWITLLKSREGGRELLLSKQPVFEVIKQCERILLGKKDGKSLWLVHFGQDVITSLSRVLNRTGFDTSRLCGGEVSDAILQSFPTNERDVYLLSDDTRKCLEETCILVDAHIFGSLSRRQDIAREFINDMDPVSCNYSLSLLEELMLLAEPPIQAIINTGIVLILVQALSLAKLSGLVFRSEACLRILSRMLKDQDENQVEEIIDHDFYEHLNCFLGDMPDGMFLPAGLDQLRESCTALNYITNTSVNMRDELLNSKIIDTLAIYTSKGAEGCQVCVDFFKTLLFDKDMPVDLNTFEIRAEPTLAHLLCSEDLELIEFVISMLNIQIKRKSFLGQKYYSSFCSFYEPLEKLLPRRSSKLRAATMNILDQLSELDYFGTATKRLTCEEYHTFERWKTAFSKSLNNKSTKTVYRACKSIGYLLRNGVINTSTYMCHQKGVLLKYINALQRLSSEGEQLTTIHAKLLSFIADVFEKKPRNQFDIEMSEIGICIFIQDLLMKKDWAELRVLLQFDDSTGIVEDELEAFLQKYRNLDIEDDLEICFDLWAKEINDISEQTSERDITGDDFIPHQQIKEFVTKLTLTIDAEIKEFALNRLFANHRPLPIDVFNELGFMNSFSLRLREKYSERVLRLMEDYRFAKNRLEYHHCGIFAILYDCVLQISIPDE